MTTRHRFTREFKAQIALEALRGDKTIQEIVARHKVRVAEVKGIRRRLTRGLSFT